MKILIASDCYIFQTNGVTNVVITLSDELQARGHDVRILALANENTSSRRENAFLIRSVPTILYPDFRISFARRDPFLDELKAWKPDLIHLHTEASIARLAYNIAKSAHAPVVVTTHTDYAKFFFGRFGDSILIRGMAKLYGKLLYRRAQAVIVPSEKAHGLAMVQAAGNRVTVIPNGIMLERFQRPVSAEDRSALLRQYGFTDHGCTLVTVARISWEKNLMEILRYFPNLLKTLPQAQLLIVGDGPDRRRLEKYVARNGLSGQVRFTGRIDPEEIYRYYASGDVFVSASTFETQGLTYLEALACGLPMVCRDDPVLRNVLVNGENGYTYQSEQEFTDGIARITRDPRKWKEMHEKALKMSANFGTASRVEQTLALYEQVLRLHSR